MSHDHEHPALQGHTLPSRVQARQHKIQEKRTTMTALIAGLALLLLVAPALVLGGYLFSSGRAAESAYVGIEDALYVDESGEFSLVPAPNGPIPSSCSITSAGQTVTLQHVGNAFVASALPAGVYTMECSGDTADAEYAFISPNPRSRVAEGYALNLGAALVAALGAGVSLWAGSRLYRSTKSA